MSITFVDTKPRVGCITEEDLLDALREALGHMPVEGSGRSAEELAQELGCSIRKVRETLRTMLNQVQVSYRYGRSINGARYRVPLYRL